MAIKRKPLQGISNVIRFNWHFYIVAIISFVVLLFLYRSTTGIVSDLSLLFLCLAVLSTLLSLLVSFYIYDYTSIYQLSWIDSTKDEILAVNISAGFDEILPQLRQKFDSVKSFDFYDPNKHTEVSIKRARKLYPPDQAIQTIESSKIPLKDAASHVILFFAAHEIRDEAERVQLFKEVRRVLASNGEVHVTEHLRDLPNFIAFNFGFFHFHSDKNWKSVFKQADLELESVCRNNPFVVTYILTKQEI